MRTQFIRGLSAVSLLPNHPRFFNTQDDCLRFFHMSLFIVILVLEQSNYRTGINLTLSLMSMTVKIEVSIMSHE